MRSSCIAIALAIAAPSAAAGGLPAELPLPPNLTVNAPTTIEVNYDQLAFETASGAAPQRGHRLHTYLSYVPEGSAPPATQTWAAWRPLLEKAGWKVVKDNSGTHYLQRGAQYLVVNVADYQDPQLDVILAPSKPTALTLPAPAAKPVAVKDNQDWPFAPAFPGAKLDGTGTSTSPFIVTLPGDPDGTVVATGFATKTYTPPKTLSKLETEAAYVPALKAAGWDVLPVHEGEGVVLAHYAKQGRNIWMAIGRAADDSNTGLRYTVADIGGDDWAAQLDKACKVQLVGIHFDFDKATIKPDSTPVLEKVLAVIKARPKQRLELSGHTDAIGDAAYNVKLSQQRAEAVVDWLAAHGADKAMLAAKGYGKTQPIADNESNEGRAQNRRVQLACVK